MYKVNNSFGLDVKAKQYIEYNSEEELIDILNSGDIADNRFLHIGEASNLLFLSDIVDVVLHSKINSIEVYKEDEENTYLRVGSGVNWDYLCGYTVERGLWGIENLSLIPGEVGASAVQNIGAYGVEVCNLIERVECIEVETGEKVVFNIDECDYSYRSSIFKGILKDKYIISYVIFKLSKVCKPIIDYRGLKECFDSSYLPTLQNIRKEIIRIREEKLPDINKIGSAGSFFKNPIISSSKFLLLKEEYPSIPHYIAEEDLFIKIPAGWLIEQCGMKGKEYNGAAVYEKQALVIVNLGNAKGKDIAELSNKVQQAVKEKFDIELEPEVQFIA